MKEKNISDSLGEAIAAYFSNKLTQSQAEDLLEWLGKSEENRNYLHELGKVWYASSQLSNKETDSAGAWIKLLDKIEADNIRPMPGREIRIPISVLYRVAAAALLIGVLGIGSIFVFRSPQKKQAVSYFEATAPKGSRSFVTLSDGSTVWLNSGTKLRYQRNFGLEGRELFLEGEAYFVVAKNREMPFIVKTSDVSITATGTAFDVKAYSEENIIETTLESGEVRIDALNTARNKSGSAPVFLKPNQKAVFIKSSKDLNVSNSRQQPHAMQNDQVLKIKTVPLRVDSLVDTKLTTSWKDSRWIFKSEKLSNLAPILERRYDISITFRDSALNSYKFTGTLKEESLEQVLKAICLAAPIRYEIKHNQVLFFENSSQKDKYQKVLKPL
jgi:ferric-dicitrate binding protein FerR (iron transport regulator)